MSAMSDYLENKLCEHVLRNVAYTTPGTSIYVGLIPYYETGKAELGTLTNKEITGGAYARVQVDGGSTGGWAASSGGATANNDDITFPTATADWGNVSGVMILDASSAGNILLHGALTTPRDVKNGDVFKFNAGDLDVTFA